ncbi:unnamed protein product [Sympodiomycopsis kandeliae]
MSANADGKAGDQARRADATATQARIGGNDQEQQQRPLSSSSNDSPDSEQASLSTTPRQSHITPSNMPMHSTLPRNTQQSQSQHQQYPHHSLPRSQESSASIGASPSASAAGRGRRDESWASAADDSSVAGQGSAIIGRGHPSRYSQETRARGISSTGSAIRDMSTSTSGNLRAGQASTSYAASDFEAQSASGLSASELDPDESGDEAPSHRSSTTLHRSSRGASTSTQGQKKPNIPSARRPAHQERRASTLMSPDRSQSRSRRTSIAAGPRNTDYLDEAGSDAYGPFDEDDDEVVPYDRGEELVRRRMKARQKEKRRKESEKKKVLQQQRNETASPGPLGSPRKRNVSTSTARPVSPIPQTNLLDREGRPTFINMPQHLQSDDPTLYSAGPASSPGPLRQGFPGIGIAVPGGTTTASALPSPAPTARRPSGAGPPQPRRVSGVPPSASQQQGSGSRISQQGTSRPHGADAQFDELFSPRLSNVESKSGVAASDTAGDDLAARSDDDDDNAEEGRDTVTDLVARKASRDSAMGKPYRPAPGEDENRQELDEEQEGLDEDHAEDEEERDGESPSNEDSSSSGDLDPDDVEYTLKDRQDAINIEHPFGLPIWKPALYKKSRTVTRNAEDALHSIPSRAAERHLLPGNLLWTVIFGVWLSLLCIIASLVLRFVPLGGSRYARVLWELGQYLFWPFGKYVEVEVGPLSLERKANRAPKGQYTFIDQDGGISYEDNAGSYTNAFTPVAARYPHDHEHRVSFNSRPASQLHGRDLALENYDTIRPGDITIARVEGGDRDQGTGPINAVPTASASSSQDLNGTENSPLKGKGKVTSYGAFDSQQDDDDDEDLTPEASESLRVERESALYEYVVDENGRAIGLSKRIMGGIAYGVFFWLIIAPVLGLICLACWGFVFTIPMAKLSWVLLKNLARQPLALHFGSAPVVTEEQLARQQQSSQPEPNSAAGSEGSMDKAKKLLFPMRPGQLASRAKSFDGQLEGKGVRKSKILLCTYRALGSQYYKYTVGGVNILFVNTLPFVGFTILDFFFLEPYAEKHHLHTGFIAWVSSQAVIFICALGSVIPLSYFIGMAVASISAQSSIGMGAVINATFGSIIEIILYAIALTQDKARLVEGSLIGSILAGVLLMPGLSMCSGATRRKEQRFNARSAGVTSTMLIMAIIGILTPTLFYQIYGTFQLSCTGCPKNAMPGQDWSCKRCFYEHVPPATDPFYQENVKGLMYTCTVILVCSYGIGLWFSLRTHASQIWQNPQPAPAQNAISHGQQVQHAQGALPHQIAQQAGDAITTAPNTISIPSAQRASIYQRILPASVVHQLLPTSALRPQSQGAFSNPGEGDRTSTRQEAPESNAREPPPLRLPEPFSQQEYAQAMALTASAFQTAMQQEQQKQQEPGVQHSRLSVNSQPGSANAAMPRVRQSSQLVAPDARRSSVMDHGGDDAGGHGGHDAPSWSRGVSLTVLISCTVLYAIIAEILVDVVDVVLDGSGIDEKFLGVTLFALVPNTTEFMNAMSFAIHGNIALSMEIGSAYALQVCLIQIPAMVAFSAYYNAKDVNGGGSLPGHLVHKSFTLIFPRWDVIAIIFSVFLLTYTYIEARSNYYRGSICILSYLVLVAGFFFAPPTGDIEAPGDGAPDTLLLHSFAALGGMFGGSPTAPRVEQFGGLMTAPSLPTLSVWSWLQACVGALWTR